jgi:hypothetical protein
MAGGREGLGRGRLRGGELGQSAEVIRMAKGIPLTLGSPVEASYASVVCGAFLFFIPRSARGTGDALQPL